MSIEWISDQEGEEFVFENAWDVAIPISFEELKGKVKISYFPKVEKEVKKWYSSRADNPLDQESLRMLWHLLSPKMRECGYCAMPGRGRWGYILRANTVMGVPMSQSFMLKEEHEAFNKTSYDIGLSVEEGLVGYGIREKGRIVSVAITHSAPCEGEACEVGVETLKTSRGKGFAVSNLRALSQHLLSMNVLPEYRCFFDNEASLRTARSAGFEEVGKFYYYVLRRKAPPKERKEG